MPGDPGVPVASTPVLSTFAQGAAGAAGTRHSPRPQKGGRELPAQPGRIAPRVVNACLKSERRHCERSEAIHLAAQKVWIAARAPLAMTVQNPLLAGCLKIESGANERLTTGIVAVCACASQTRLA